MSERKTDFNDLFGELFSGFGKDKKSAPRQKSFEPKNVDLVISELYKTAKTMTDLKLQPLRSGGCAIVFEELIIQKFDNVKDGKVHYVKMVMGVK